MKLKEYFDKLYELNIIPINFSFPENHSKLVLCYFENLVARISSYI